VLLVGARYACPRCLRRGPVRACTRCAKPGFDLEEPPGAVLLRKAQIKGELRPSGSMAALWDRQSTTARVEWGVAVVVTIVGGVVMFRGANAGLEGPMVLLGIPIFVAFIALIRLIAFLAFLVLRMGLMLVLLALALVAAVIEMVLKKLALVDSQKPVSAALLKGLPLLMTGLFNRFTLTPVTPTLGAPTFAGTLETALDTRWFAGRTGDMEFADALPIDVVVAGREGEHVRVTLDAGGIDLGEHAPAGKASHKVNPDDEGPTWLRRTPPHDRGRRVIPKGTGVTFHGGEWGKAGEARVLRGTHEQPLWAVFE
jgi:hypothetical protein